MSLIQGMIDGLANNASSLYQTIATIVANAAAVGGATSSGSASVPGYQFGGIVPGPLGAPQLAVVHGGERIIPTGRSSSGGVTINIGTLYGTSREVAEQTARYLAAQLRREGVL